MEPDLSDVHKATRAACAELHARALESGYLVRPRRDPGNYRFEAVWPIAYALLATGLVEVRDE